MSLQLFPTSDPWNLLPNEILLLITSFILSPGPYASSKQFQDLSRLSRTCRHLHSIVTPTLYFKAAQYYSAYFTRAINSGSEIAVDRFLHTGIKSMRPSTYLNALNVATCSRDLNMVRKFISVYEQEQEGSNVLALAAYLEGVTLEATPLSIAAAQGDLETVELLVDIDPPPKTYYSRSSPYIVDDVDIDRIIPTKEMYLLDALHAACRSKHTHLIRLLLDHGAPINGVMPRMRGGLTALHIACTATELPIVSLLLEHGVDPDCQDAEGRPALLSAQANLPIIERLADAGANLERRSPTGWSVISKCVVCADRHPSCVKTVRYLLESKGMDPNDSIPSHSLTLLHLAVIFSPACIPVLLEFGANGFLVLDHNFKTPIEHAMTSRNEGDPAAVSTSVKLLLDAMSKEYYDDPVDRECAQMLCQRAESWLDEH